MTKILIDEAAVKLVLEALEAIENGTEFWDEYPPSHPYGLAKKAITALKALAEQPAQQEPVATVTSETGADISMSWWHEPALPIGTKLYTTPQPAQRTWVGLTEEDKHSIEIEAAENDFTDLGVILATEAKLKEKHCYE